MGSSMESRDLTRLSMQNQGELRMNIAIWLNRRAAVEPERGALFAGEHQIATYGSFSAQVLSLGAALQARGFGPGQQVAIFMKNAPEYLIALYGILSAGAAAVPINAKLHTSEAAFILENSGAGLCIASPEHLQGLVQAAPDVQFVAPGGPEWTDMLATPPLEAPQTRAPADLAWLFYTSGTTGKPKGVMITHGMLMATSLSYLADVDTVHAEDTALYAAPLSHGAGLYSFVHVQAGARHVCLPSGGFEVAELFALAAHHGRAHMFAAPTMIKRMVLDAQSYTGGLRTVVYGGGPMYSADIIDAVETFGPVFVQIYGQGESPMCITALSRADVADRSHPRWRARLASVGRAQSVVEVQIGGPDGTALPVGETGEIMVRGAPVMPGYWRNPQATAQALRGGWLMTGDVGSLDSDGYLTLQDRSKDVIITGGTNVYPREVEEVLLTHADVQEVSVVGRPNAEWGEEVVAFVVGAAPDAELDALCLAQIARFKRPKAYIRVESLPKNNYGKVLKTELRLLL